MTINYNFGNSIAKTKEVTIDIFAQLAFLVKPNLYVSLSELVLLSEFHFFLVNEVCSFSENDLLSEYYEISKIL